MSGFVAVSSLSVADKKTLQQYYTIDGYVRLAAGEYDRLKSLNGQEYTLFKSQRQMEMLRMMTDLAAVNAASYRQQAAMWETTASAVPRNICITPLMVQEGYTL